MTAHAEKGDGVANARLIFVGNLAGGMSEWIERAAQMAASDSIHSDF
jgi:hypothetical protein